MTMQKAICPSCGAPLPGDGYSAFVQCGYCGTRVNIPPAFAPPPPVGARAPQQPQRPRSPLEIERDDLLQRLRQQEHEWQVRIGRAGAIGAADILAPLAGAIVFPAVIAIVMMMLGAERLSANHEALGALLGCSFWLSIPIVALVIYRALARRREKRARIVAGHRDQALAPLRARIAQMEQQLAGPVVISERQRRLEALTMQRRELAQQIDFAYARVENARGAAADLVFVPLTGCGAGALVAMLIAAWGTRFFTKVELWSDEQAGWALVAAFVLPIPVAIVAAIARWVRRRYRVAKLTAERDVLVPTLQKQLNDVENELQRLTRG